MGSWVVRRREQTGGFGICPGTGNARPGVHLLSLVPPLGAVKSTPRSVTQHHSLSEPLSFWSWARRLPLPLGGVGRCVATADCTVDGCSRGCLTHSLVLSPPITQPYSRRGMVIPQVFKDLGKGVKRSWLFLVAGRPVKGVRGGLGLWGRVSSRALVPAGGLHPSNFLSLLSSEMPQQSCRPDKLPVCLHGPWPRRGLCGGPSCPCSPGSSQAHLTGPKK